MNQNGLCKLRMTLLVKDVELDHLMILNSFEFI